MKELIRSTMVTSAGVTQRHLATWDEHDNCVLFTGAWIGTPPLYARSEPSVREIVAHAIATHSSPHILAEVGHLLENQS